MVRFAKKIRPQILAFFELHFTTTYNFTFYLGIQWNTYNFVLLLLMPHFSFRVWRHYLHMYSDNFIYKIVFSFLFSGIYGNGTNWNSKKTLFIWLPNSSSSFSSKLMKLFVLQHLLLSSPFTMHDLLDCRISEKVSLNYPLVMCVLC